MFCDSEETEPALPPKLYVCTTDVQIPLGCSFTITRITDTDTHKLLSETPPSKLCVSIQNGETTRWLQLLTGCPVLRKWKIGSLKVNDRVLVLNFGKPELNVVYTKRRPDARLQRVVSGGSFCAVPDTSVVESEDHKTSEDKTIFNNRDLAGGGGSGGGGDVDSLGERDSEDKSLGDCKENKEVSDDATPAVEAHTGLSADFDPTDITKTWHARRNYGANIPESEFRNPPQTGFSMEEFSASDYGDMSYLSEETFDIGSTPSKSGTNPEKLKDEFFKAISLDRVAKPDPASP